MSDIEDPNDRSKSAKNLRFTKTKGKGVQGVPNEHN